MQFAILISVLVALLLGAFILLTHIQSFFKIKSQEVRNAFEKSNVALFTSLDKKTEVLNDTIISRSETEISKENTTFYGAWSKQYSEVSAHHLKAIRIAFTGSEYTDKTPNLYLENTNSPLVVVGNTRLEGNSFLPKQGIKAGNISGKYYQGSSLYYGRVFESSESLPKLRPEWITYLEQLFQGKLIDESDVVSLEKEMQNSFHDPMQIVYDPDPIYLGTQKIAGNIVIQSGSQIIIAASSLLKDVVLIAPKIIIQDNVKGSFQCIASKTVEVGKRCYLSYPSSLVLLDQERVSSSTNTTQIQNAKPKLSIDSNTVVEGAIAYLSKYEPTQNRIQTHIEIAPKTEIIGEIYCQGNIDVQSTIWGSIYAKQFMARQSGSVYLNHLYEVKVLKSPVINYAGFPFVNSKKSIAKWLY